MTTNDPDNIVPLSQYRAQLSRGQRARRADALFDAEDPPAAIAALPPDEFFYVVHELGFPEALEVLVHATAEQLQCALDFSLWDHDSLSMEKASEWLGAIAEAPVEKIGAWAKELDVELLARLIRERARIYDLNLEEVPDQCEGVLWNSPDSYFTLELLGDPDTIRVTQHLVDSLYRYSPSFARRMLVGMRADLDSELEEVALRWRNGRMADLGFADFDEAMKVYQEIDPAKVHLGEAAPSRVKVSQDPGTGDALRLPLVMADRLITKTPFARAMASVSDPGQLSELHLALVTLCNRILSADRVSPADDESVRQVMERVGATLDLGIEFMARGDEAKEAQAIRDVAMTKLFQLGHSLILKARKLAVALTQKTPFAVLRPKVVIFDREDQEILASLTKLRPLFPRTLEQPPIHGERPFATLADLATVSLALDRIGAKVELLLAIGVRPEHLSPERLELLAPPVPPETVETGMLARTLLVRHLLDLPLHPLEPIPPAAVEQFKNNFINNGKLSDIAIDKSDEFLRAPTLGKGLRPAQRWVADEWIASLNPLHSLFGAEKV